MSTFSSLTGAGSLIPAAARFNRSSNKSRSLADKP